MDALLAAEQSLAEMQAVLDSDAFDDAAAERLEQQVAALVAAGADEAEVRALVREAMRLGRR